MDELIIAFERTTDAIRIEKLLIGAGLAPLVMPLPAAIRAGCGVCLRIAPDALGAAAPLLDGVPTALYIRRVLPGGSRYEPLPGPT